MKRLLITILSTLSIFYTFSAHAESKACHVYAQTDGRRAVSWSVVKGTEALPLMDRFLSIEEALQFRNTGIVNGFCAQEKPLQCYLIINPIDYKTPGDQVNGWAIYRGVRELLFGETTKERAQNVLKLLQNANECAK